MSSLDELLERATRSELVPLGSDASELRALQESWQGFAQLLEKADAREPLHESRVAAILACCEAQDSASSSGQIRRRPRWKAVASARQALLTAALALLVIATLSRSGFQLPVSEALQTQRSGARAASSPLASQPQLVTLTPVAWKDDVDGKLDELQRQLLLVRDGRWESAGRAAYARDALADMDAELEESSL